MVNNQNTPHPTQSSDLTIIGQLKLEIQYLKQRLAYYEAMFERQSKINRQDWEIRQDYLPYEDEGRYE